MGEFEKNQLIQDAVLMQFQHLGESATKLKQHFPEEDRLPFLEIISFRNLIAHDYLGIESAKVYEIAVEELPKLEQILAQMD
jgi:uncharacterized protein with HEPN domain